jgi:hypothetical protein
MDEEGGIFEYEDYLISIYSIKRWPNKPAAYSWTSVSLARGTEETSRFEFKSKFAAVCAAMLYVNTRREFINTPPIEVRSMKCIV